MKFPFTPLFLSRIAKFATKVSVDLEENVAKALQAVEFKPRKHPGVVKVKTIKMPEFLVNTISKVTGDYPLATLCQDAEALDRYLWSRHPPPAAEEVKKKQENFRELLIEKHKFNFEEMSETERHHANNLLFQKVKNRLHKEVYSWKNLQFDPYKALQYLLGRSPGEYAAMYKILTEIRDRNEEFTPKSYFDFGSGVGSALWATINIWPREKIFEYFLVDASREMNDLAELILRRGNPDVEPMVRNYFFRQFLPASTTNTYDLVVCAYTLFELPSKDVRLKTLKTLWAKCENYMIVVERGTRAGFNLVTEARNFLLSIDPENCHVHSPCPHDFSCPRKLEDDGSPCNFEVKYENLEVFHKNRIQNETFSYVVLRKKSRDVSQSEDSWPRIVRPVLVRKKHSICRMCTKEGKLQEVIFTAAKHGKLTYQCARRSNWGDRLPVSIVNPEPEESPVGFRPQLNAMFAADPKKVTKTKRPEELANLRVGTSKSNVEATLDPTVDPTANIKELSRYLQSLESPALKQPVNQLLRFAEEFEDYSNLRPPSPTISLQELNRVPSSESEPEMANRDAVQAYKKGIVARAQQSEVEIFGQFVVMMLRKMNESSRFTTMSKMSSVLFENFLVASSSDVQMDEQKSDSN